MATSSIADIATSVHVFYEALSVTDKIFETRKVTCVKKYFVISK